MAVIVLTFFKAYLGMRPDFSRGWQDPLGWSTSLGECFSGGGARIWLRAFQWTKFLLVLGAEMTWSVTRGTAALLLWISSQGGGPWTSPAQERTQLQGEHNHTPSQGFSQKHSVYNSL